MRYLLDTSICVFFLRGRLNLDKIVKELILVTDNTKDFKLLNGIQMENWFERV
ncbi:hypothetical protein [Flavobacterium sp. FlaQc-47]|uniref:hypothetical protein n=1 Tax=Flavobacterium sp. FlaQc-47 TaxID=3374180 RepID=UPI0037580336